MDHYVKEFADEIRTDHVGNAIAVLNPAAPFKVLLAGHCDEIGLMIQRIDERGFLFLKNGWRQSKSSCRDAGNGAGLSGNLYRCCWGKCAASRRNKG